MTTPKMDNENIERLIDIIGDGGVAAEAQERLHQEGPWPPMRACGKRPMRPSVRPPKWVAKLGSRGRDIQRPMDDKAFIGDIENLSLFVKTFKRDYARLSILPDAETVIALLPASFRTQ